MIVILWLPDALTILPPRWSCTESSTFWQAELPTKENDKTLAQFSLRDIYDKTMPQQYTPPPIPSPPENTTSYQRNLWLRTPEGRAYMQDKIARAKREKRYLWKYEQFVLPDDRVVHSSASNPAPTHAPPQDDHNPWEVDPLTLLANK